MYLIWSLSIHETPRKNFYLWRSVILINVYVFVRRAKICISVSITTESPSSFDTLVEVGESGHKYSVISILRLCDALKRFRFREVYSVLILFRGRLYTDNTVLTLFSRTVRPILGLV